jgi:hypothetical protein
MRRLFLALLFAIVAATSADAANVCLGLLHGLLMLITKLGDFTLLGNLFRLLKRRLALELDRTFLLTLRDSLCRLEPNVGTLGKTIFVFQLLIRLSLSVSLR